MLHDFSVTKEATLPSRLRRATSPLTRGDKTYVLPFIQSLGRVKQSKPRNVRRLALGEGWKGSAWINWNLSNSNNRIGICDNIHTR